MMGLGTPLRIEGIEGVREEGNDDRDACRVRLLLALATVPFVEGRCERTDDMALARRVFALSRECRTTLYEKQCYLQSFT